MRKVFTILVLFALCFSLSACKDNESEQRYFGENFQDVEVENEQNNTEEGTIKVEGLIVKDGDDFMLLADGNQIQLVSKEMLEDYLDKKVMVIGEYDEEGKLLVQKIEEWKTGRLFNSVNNLYLTQNDGSHLLLQGSVVPELIGKYIGREARLKGQFIGDNTKKFKVLEYYIEGVKTDVYQQYENTEFGFKIKYPPAWQVNEEKLDVNGKATNVIFSKDNLEVVLIVQKDIPRPALKSDEIEKKVLPSGLVVSLYHDTDAMDGNNLDKVIFDLPKSDYDFYLAGYGVAFNQMFQSLELEMGQ